MEPLKDQLTDDLMAAMKAERRVSWTEFRRAGLKDAMACSWVVHWVAESVVRLAQLMVGYLDKMLDCN